jgi:ankyrin repeat protein
MDLFEAIKAKDIEQVRALLKQISDLDEINFDYESTPLIVAIEYGNEAIFSEILKAGASPFTSDVTDTPLTAAVSSRLPGIVEILIQAGVDVNEPIEDGITPLMCAASSHCIECVKLLVEAGAHIHDIDSDGETAHYKSRGDVRVYLKSLSDSFGKE